MMFFHYYLVFQSILYYLKVFSFSHQSYLMIFHWCLRMSLSPQVFKTLLSILDDLNNAVVWMASSYSRIAILLYRIILINLYLFHYVNLNLFSCLHLGTSSDRVFKVCFVRKWWLWIFLLLGNHSVSTQFSLRTTNIT